MKFRFTVTLAICAFSFVLSMFLVISAMFHPHLCSVSHIDDIFGGFASAPWNMCHKFCKCYMCNEFKHAHYCNICVFYFPCYDFPHVYVCLSLDVTDGTGESFVFKFGTWCDDTV